MSTKIKREEYDASPTSKSSSLDPQRPRAESEAPKRERRSRHRVADEQGTGQGSMSALSKLKMLERHRAAVTPRRSEDY
ncbi:hypothetical protein [Caenimonas aquaedulcis]|uniref:Uncharacterized protein n=1 Tax=Caenimonas aquaedulcis TaxID=2793270 RepID=A0A931MIR7_9BURK|nr:hypothetical protein [Caenimonas aquaedulcis]MBG9390124.1 hypothetical protein [Caenimonas aquaedulcis]